VRTLNDTGLIRVEIHEWPSVRQALLASGYVPARRSRGTFSDHILVDPDRDACVSHYQNDENCYYLDERVRPCLPRPVGRPYRPDPYVDLGGES